MAELVNRVAKECTPRSRFCFCFPDIVIRRSFAGKSSHDEGCPCVELVRQTSSAGPKTYRNENEPARRERCLAGKMQDGPSGPSGAVRRPGKAVLRYRCAL